ncbi:MAG: rhodanese-related sulfurtransferase [Gammaproteobacteria bacterium]|nr:rhodanese-related sulfurtransferase [Gammaproteobacteria bacterium]
MTASLSPHTAPVMVASFYKFVTLAQPRAVGALLGERARALGLLGTLLLAEEGLNASIAGTPAAVREFLDFLRADARFANLRDVRESSHDAAPFRRLKIKYKREIVTMGVPGIAPAERTGSHVTPSAWNELLQDPEVLLVDTRNSYEVRVGTFEGALDLGMDSFRQFPALIDAELERSGATRVAMFCTGGIRCEKASAYLLERGVEAVYQLEGGILNYLEHTPREASRWQGDCFVFDERVALDAALSPGEFTLCFACRRPLGVEDRASPLYREAECCPHCHDELSQEKRRGFAERRRQVALAEARHERHVGAVMPVRDKSDMGP